MVMNIPQNSQHGAGLPSLLKMSMETTLYIIIAAIVLAMGWIVWSVIKEGRPELPNKEDEK